jgi:hypothetical protein
VRLEQTIPSALAGRKGVRPLEKSVGRRLHDQEESMAITSVKNVTNLLGDQLLFINTESSRDNRYLPPTQTTGVNDAWIPWCGNPADFPFHHLEIIDTATGTVLWYIWQHWSKDGDFVRASKKGYEDPGPDIGGVAQVGGERNLWIDGAGMRADRV